MERNLSVETQLTSEQLLRKDDYSPNIYDALEERQDQQKLVRNSTNSLISHLIFAMIMCILASVSAALAIDIVVRYACVALAVIVCRAWVRQQ